MLTKDIRRIAREHMKGSWGLSIGVAAIACLLGGLLVGTLFLPDEFTYRWNLSVSSATQIGIKYGVLGLASIVLGGVLQLGYAVFLLRQHDGQDLKLEVLFSQLDRFGTGFAQAFLRSLYTLLWSLLFIIPGIVAAYRYAMTPFILAEHPELTASQAIARSKELMMGRKFDLFLLDLSFLGWVILAALTMNLGHLFLNPYRNAAYAVFYRNITAQGSSEF